MVDVTVNTTEIGMPRTTTVARPAHGTLIRLYLQFSSLLTEKPVPNLFSTPGNSDVLR